MADMGTVQFWSDHRNKKAPKPINREPRIIDLPKYVIKQLDEHRNTFIHKEYKIEDVMHTIKNKYHLDCVYQFDGDNGYILRVVI